jgi:hypothetical protein
MILHMHDDKTQGEEQLTPPTENKQMGAPLEKGPEPTPTSPRRWKGVLLSILGIVLPCVGGFLISWPWPDGESLDILFVFLGACLLVFVGAALLRSWWAITIVPIAFIAGEILARNIVIPLVQGWYCGNIPDITCPASGWYSPGWASVQAIFETGVIWRELTNIVLVIPIVLLLAGFGAAIGIFYRGRLSNWLQNRRQQR